MPGESLAEPWKMPDAVQQSAKCLIGVDYPAPVVNLVSSTDKQTPGRLLCDIMSTVGLAPVVQRLSPTASYSGTRTKSKATEAAFLAYSETDVEHDLVRIIHLLSGNEGGSEPVGARRFLRRRSSVRRLRVHPVVVLDEVDKITDGRQESLAMLEALLGQLKNVLAARGAHFLVIGGPDLHDQAVRDADRGSGVYESVFSWSVYVPCLWGAPARLLRGTVSPDSLVGPGDPEAEKLLGYLTFKARGIPRRLLHEFNAFVAWDGDRPRIQVQEEDWPRIEFYHQLEGVTSKAIDATQSESLTALPIDADRVRLSSYYVVDWTLRSRGRPFNATDIVDANEADPMLRMTAPAVDYLLRHLAEADVLVVISKPDRPDATQFGRGVENSFATYVLSDSYRQMLAVFVRRSESERAALGITALQFSPAPPAAEGRAPVGPAGTSLGIFAERFELLSVLGQGGMGTVYSALNLLTGERVAVKVLRREMAPEQLAGDRTDIRSDLFALGVLLYRCLQGESPWGDALAMDVVFRILNANVRVDDLPASKALRDVIGHLLKRDMNLRPDPEQFLAELAQTPEAEAALTFEAYIATGTSRELPASGSPIPAVGTETTIVVKTYR